MATGHVERIRFTKGVRQLEGASLESPYDLTNAEIDQYGFLRSLSDVGTYSDDTGLVSDSVKPVARSPIDGSWVSGPAADALAFQHGILYVADESGSPRIKVYQEESDDQSGLPPRLTSISADTAGGGDALTKGTYATYLFIPVNSRGEAGPWRAKTVGDYSNDVNMEFSVIVSETVEWVEVYRTPEFDMVARENDPSPSLFYYVNRFSTIEEIPGGANAGTYAVKYKNIPWDDRTPKTGIDYVGVSENISDKDFTSETHYISFPRLLDDTNLSEDTKYEITGTKQINGVTYLVLGNAPSFDSTDLMRWKKGDRNHRMPERYSWYTENVDLVISKSDGAGGTIKVDTIEVIDNGPKMRINGAINTAPRRGGRSRGGGSRGRRRSSSSSGGGRQSSGGGGQRRPRGSSMGRGTTAGDRRTRSSGRSRSSTEKQVDLTPTSAPLTRSRNVHTQVNVLSTPQYRGFTTRTMFYSGGVMYYGAPKWPTKEPMLTRKETDTNNGYDVRLQLRYRTKDGERYGPYIEIQNCTLASVTYQGELGVNVYVKFDTDSDGNDEWVLYKRQTPNDYGGYGPHVFKAEDFNENYLEVKGVDPENTYLRENNVVLMSATNRPWEATFTRHFAVPGDETVRTMFKARLREDDMKAYNFYVATDEAMYVANPVPENDSVHLDPVTPNIGIKESHMWASVPNGAIFCGTDGRLHYITGRKMRFLETEEATPFNNVRDLAYDIRNNELAVATDTGIWYYDFERQGWTKQLNFLGVDVLFWDRKNELLVARKDSSFYQLDESGGELVGYVVTQLISNVTDETHVERVEVDYEKSGYQEGDSSTWATVQHAVRHPGVLQIDELASNHPNKVNFEVQIPSNRPRFLKLEGRGHQFAITGFSELREIKLQLSNSGKGNNA